MLKNVFMIVVVSILTACSSVPQKQIVTVTEYKYITIDDSLLSPCIPDKPIDKDSYLALSIDKRESELTNYIIHLLSTNKQCNIQIANIRSLNEKFKQLQNQQPITGQKDDSKQTYK